RRESEQQGFGDVSPAHRAEDKSDGECPESAEKEEEIEAKAAPLRLQGAAHRVQEPETDRGPEQAVTGDRSGRREQERDDAPDLTAQYGIGVEPEQVRHVRAGEDEKVQRTRDPDDPEDDALRRVPAEAALEAGEKRLHGA